MMDYKKIVAELNGMDSPIVRWSILILILVMFWTMFFEPFVAWKEAQSNVLAKRSVEMSKLKALKASRDSWQKAMLLYQQEFSKTSTFFFSQGVTVSQGEMQQLLAKIAKKNHLKIVAQKSYEAAPEPDLGMRLSVSFTLRGHADDVVRFIVAVGSYPKLLVLDELRVVRQHEREMVLSVRLSAYVLEVQGSE